MMIQVKEGVCRDEGKEGIWGRRKLGGIRIREI